MPAPQSDYALYPDGRFVIKDYNRKRPFSNFLPGIAGLYGTPMWAFYVNRGQAMASFGTKDKDHAMLEFYPANKAYQMVTSHGFRTFVQFRHNTASKYAFYEPFRPHHDAHAQKQTLEVSSHEVGIEDSHASGLRTAVTYFTVPGEPIAALARQVVFTNTSDKELDLQVLDGLPLVNPYGMNEYFIKQMSRTIEAWMMVENMQERAPFFRLKVDASDRPEVVFIHEGNFYFSSLSERGGRSKPLDMIVDPEQVFASSLDFSDPIRFNTGEAFRMPPRQITESRTPCAFSFAAFHLGPGKSKAIYSFAGQARSREALNRFAAKARAADYPEDKREENRRLIESLKRPVFSVSSSQAYDLYCGQTYLDNAMRGGLPVVVGPAGSPLVFYVYSRKHGDLERDYNRFLVEPTYFAQGDGNYRDVNQNRRNDVWFEPRVGEANIRTFLDLIQLDGFNPLVLKGACFHFKKTAASAAALRKALGAKGTGEALSFLSHSFSLGEFYRFLEEKKFVTRAGFERLLSELAPFFESEDKAEHGEGFWVDHWTYNLDLIESYLAIYPERLRSLVLEQRRFTFFDNDHRVRPRDEKYFLLKNGTVRQYGSVFKDEEKEKLLKERKHRENLVRVHFGRGDIYRTTLFVKLFSLFLNKFSSLDAQGVGVEMEADKPSWYDALNGLPGLFGSSLPETFELKRLAIFLLETIDSVGTGQSATLLVPAEIESFMNGVRLRLDKHRREKGPRTDFVFWDGVTACKEKFRQETAYGISGRERKVSFAEIKAFLEHAREKIEKGLQKSFDAKTGLFPTYFENDAKTKPVSSKAGPEDPGLRVRAVQFRQKELPHFLEAAVHALKVEKNPERRKQLFRAVRASRIYDKKLGMYKVNAPMDAAPLEVGRGRIFTPGWLENESVWLHMEYKFILEALKSGLHEEFFEDFRKVLVPFQPVERYGRSLLENSSFIVSSAFPDESLHGAGFVARLSGSTAEFLNMWLLMNIGKRPFCLGPDGKLLLRFEPHLPAFLFLKEDTVRTMWNADGEEEKIRFPKDSLAFLFLGKTLVVYHNPKRLDAFGKMRVAVKKVTLHDKQGGRVDFRGDAVPSPYAEKVRDKHVPRIDIELG